MADGTIFEGNYVNGELSGEGKVTLPNGDTIIGSFVNNKLNGKCVLTTSNGKVFDAYYEDDILKSSRKRSAFKNFMNKLSEWYITPAIIFTWFYVQQ